MRKLLMSLLLILILVVTGLCMANGIKIGGLQVYGITGIKELNSDLDYKISEANTANSNYTTMLNKLKEDISTLADAKEECLNLINVSTDSQIKEATQTKNYTIEYLWSRVGNHATAEGVTINMDVTSGTLDGYRTLKFTVTGNYLAIVNFVTSLENDSALEFTIDEFTMVQGQATFTVYDVKVIEETITASDGTTTTSVTTDENGVTTITTTTTTTSETTSTSSNETE